MNLLKSDYNLDTMQLIDLLILVMVTSSFCGFIYELLFYRIDLGYFVKRGSSYGPWIPIYAFGVLAYALLVYRFKDKPLLVFLLCVIVSGLLEYATGWFLYNICDTRLWDYNTEIWNFGNIGGYVCFRSVLVFGLAGLMLIYVVIPMLVKIMNRFGYTNEYSYEYATEHPAYLEENNMNTEEINCWGDSITEGYGSDGLTYPDVLEELTGIPVRNLGVGGEDSRDILRRSIAYGSQEEDILVIQMGDNGGWRNLGQLIRQYRELISEAGTDRYIIISSTDDPNDFEQIWGYTTEPVGLENTWYEEEFEEEFGEHLFNGRKYLIEYGLQINGIRRTETDYMRAKSGCISLQLRNPWIDNTHLNEAGYTALAHGVYEKGKELGYW